MGDGEGMEEEKGMGSVSTPREVPSNFSAVVAPMLQSTEIASTVHREEQRSIDVSCRPGLLLLDHAGTDRRTDAVPIHHNTPVSRGFRPRDPCRPARNLFSSLDMMRTPRQSDFSRRSFFYQR